MREILVILLAILLLALLTAWRYRKQIMVGVNIWRQFKEMQSQIRGSQTSKPIETPKSSNTQLVRCSKCGIWVPEENAVRLASNVFYCTTACMERSVKAA